MMKFNEMRWVFVAGLLCGCTTEEELLADEEFLVDEEELLVEEEILADEELLVEEKLLVDEAEILVEALTEEEAMHADALLYGEDVAATWGPDLVGGEDIANDPLALSQKPRMWAPFPSGKSYRCSQGPSGAYSHNFTNTKYALDFVTPAAGAAEPITAALAGQVAYVVNNCTVGNVNCGGGFGNQVRINHGGGWFSVYAHLSSVSVAVGNKVGRGQTIGYEGNTGNSTADHLHFSLHQGNAAQVAMPASVSYSIRDKNVTLNDAFAYRDASNHVCGSVGVGHIYASDNACTTVHNTLGSAKPITNNTAYLGETCSVGDVDYFSFGGKAGTFTSSVTSTTESISDCSCSILNAQGVELQQGGPEGYTRNDGFNGSEGCACSLANATAATYYLKIYSQMPGGYILNKTLP